MENIDTLVDQVFEEVNYNLGLMVEGAECYTNRGMTREEYGRAILIAVSAYLDQWLKEFEDTDEE